MIKRILNNLLWRTFPLWERLGIHVLPVHFYSPIPDTRELRAHPGWFTTDHPMDGVDMREEEQLKLLEQVVKPYEGDYVQSGKDPDPDGKDLFGLDESRMTSYAPANALTLYALIRHLKPKRVIEVGSGMSTFISTFALRENGESKAGVFKAIEPYPSPALKHVFGGFAELIQKKVEDVPLDEFRALGENDILFIDSSHTVKAGGDVNHLFLRVLPALRPGVIIHVHDIFFPREYLPHHFFGGGIKQIWQEQYLLHAFLMFNSQFEVMLSSSYLHFKRPRELKALFPWYHENRCPSSFWMRRKKA